MAANRPSTDSTLFYRIKCGADFDFTGTRDIPAGQPKDTYLYVSSDGRLRRWRLENPGDTDAQWLIYPSEVQAGSITYVIQSVHIPRRITGKDPVGWIRIWEPMGGIDGSPDKKGTQCFKLISAGDKWFNIQVLDGPGPAGWVFDVDNEGFVSLQPPRSTPSQKFTLEPVEGSVKKRPTAFLVPREQWRAIEDIPVPPKLESASLPGSTRTKLEFIAEEIVPGALVHDPSYNDRLIQVRDHPYYHLQWESYWDSSGDDSFTQYPPNTASTLTIEVETGMETLVEEEFTKTVGVTFKLGASSTLPIPAAGLKVDATAGLDITNTEETRKLQRTTKKENRKQGYTVTISKTPHLSAVKTWRRVNRYTLRTMGSHSEVQKVWEAVVQGAMRVYPDIEAGAVKEKPEVATT